MLGVKRRYRFFPQLIQNRIRDVVRTIVGTYAVFQSPHSQGTLDMVNLEAWIKNRQGLPQERKPDVPSVIP